MNHLLNLIIFLLHKIEKDNVSNFVSDSIVNKTKH